MPTDTLTATGGVKNEKTKTEKIKRSKDLCENYPTSPRQHRKICYAGWD